VFLLPFGHLYWRVIQGEAGMERMNIMLKPFVVIFKRKLSNANLNDKQGNQAWQKE
jgi:hypothetical protein